VKISCLVVFDVPHDAPEPTPEMVARVRGILFEVVRKNTEAATEVHVSPHTLTPAERAALP
jgi:hypothetical protein